MHPVVHVVARSNGTGKLDFQRLHPQALAFGTSNGTVFLPTLPSDVLNMSPVLEPSTNACDTRPQRLEPQGPSLSPGHVSVIGLRLPANALDMGLIANGRARIRGVGKLRICRPIPRGNRLPVLNQENLNRLDAKAPAGRPRRRAILRPGSPADVLHVGAIVDVIVG